MINRKDLASNQHPRKGDKVTTKFLCVHDDRFGRAFAWVKDIIAYIEESNQDALNKDDFEFEAQCISRSEDNKINAFVLYVCHPKKYHQDISSVENDSFFEDNKLYGVPNLEDIRYYTVVHCDFA